MPQLSSNAEGLLRPLDSAATSSSSPSRISLETMTALPPSPPLAINPSLEVSDMGKVASPPPLPLDARESSTTPVFDWTKTAKEFIAGSFAGAIAEVIMHPIDTLNIRMKAERQPPFKYSTSMRMALRNILREEGVRALYSGVSCTVAAALPISGIYFASYELSKKIGLETFGPQWSSPVYLVSGALAEACCSSIQIPVELVRSRVQLQGAQQHLGLPYRYAGPAQAFRQIVREEGFLALYCGLRSSLLLDCAYSSLQFLFYEQLRKAASRILDRKLKTRDNLVVGGLAGFLAGGVTNPLDVITCRLQTQGINRRYFGVLDCARKIRVEEGLMGFTKGMGPRLVWVTPLTAITFAAYEGFKTLFHLGDSRAHGLGVGDEDEEDDPDDIWV